MDEVSRWLRNHALAAEARREDEPSFLASSKAAAMADQTASLALGHMQASSCY